MNHFIHIFTEAEAPDCELILNTDHITHIESNKHGFCDIFVYKGNSSISKIRTLLGCDEVHEQLQNSGAKFIRYNGPNISDEAEYYINTKFIIEICAEAKYNHCIFICDPETGLWPRYETFYKMSDLIEFL